MASNVIVFTIKGVTEGAVKAVQKVRASLAKVAKIGALVGTALVAAFSFAVKSIIDVGSKTENLRVRLDALLGSTQEGGKAFKKMAEFAGTVPFAYEEIMESATALAGVVTGGADEIAGWMPLITDLATVSGLSIADTTGQVQRMMSAGAASADMFRERGITAMLGFQAGVTVSAEETKRRLKEAFTDPASKFRGAAQKMATTWDGILSMIGDKWFTFKSNVAESGVFNYIKSIALVIDKQMGDALKNGSDSAKSMSDSIITAMKNLLIGVGFAADAVRGLQFVYAGLLLIFAKVAEGMLKWWFLLIDGGRKFINLFPSLETAITFVKLKFATMTASLLKGIFAIAEGFREFANMTGLIDISPFTVLESTLNSANDTVTGLRENLNASMSEVNIDPLKTFESIIRDATARSAELGLELDEIALKPMPSEAVQEFQDRINETFDVLQSRSEEITDGLIAPLEELTQFQKNWEAQQTIFFDNAKNNTEEFAKSFFKLMDVTVKNISKGIATVVVEGGNLMNVFKNIAKDVMKSIITLLIQMGIKSILVNKGVSASKVGEAGAAGVASMAAAPWPINMTAPSFGALMSATAGGYGASITGISGILHGGLSNVPSESTFLLQRGERVLSPNQNRDFTDFILSNNGGESSGGTVIENVEIHILENATNAEALLEMDRSDMEELVADKIIPALDSLDDQGIKLNSISRGNL